MMVEPQSSKPKKGYLTNSTLLLIAFATAFFPRIVQSAGIPSIVNFVHFAVVPAACGIVLVKTKIRDRQQIASVQTLVLSLAILLGIMLTSALINDAGLINVAIDFLLLAESFLFLAALVSIGFSPESLQRFRKWILGFALIHLVLAFCQHILITVGALPITSMTPEDNVQGVFYLSGSGHVVGASVSIAVGLYFLIAFKASPLWIRLAVAFATFMHMLFADAKQALMVLLAAWAILILLEIKDIKKTIQYVVLAVLVGYTFYWCMENLPAFAAFKTWIRPEIYGPNGDATLLKTAPFRIIPTYYESFLNNIFGLGPGHTVGRLGGWMLIDYGYLLKPLGATIHPASEAVWETRRGNYLDSSFFSPLFGFAGIWGDLGFLGLASYLGIYLVIWRLFCPDDLSKILVISILLNGLIFTQLEEPGYMISLMTLIGLRWHECQQKLKRPPQLFLPGTYLERSSFNTPTSSTPLDIRGD